MLSGGVVDWVFPVGALFTALLGPQQGVEIALPGLRYGSVRTIFGYHFVQRHLHKRADYFIMILFHLLHRVF